MKIFIDECVDWRLARDLTGHDVQPARQLGWLTIKNGELLALAGRDFDVFLTVDRNLAFQQNRRDLPVAVLVLRARTNHFADLKRLVPQILVALRSIRPGTIEYVGED